MNNTVQLITLGCAKNRVDSEVILGSLLAAGFHIVDDQGDATVRIINTCTFIGPARKEAVKVILEAVEAKKEGRIEKIVVSGCMVQRYENELAVELPEVDLFIGTAGFDKIVDLLESDQRRVIVDKPDYLYNETTARENTLSPYSAYVKIAEGCSKRCSFCVVPRVRGSLRSRTIASIRAEVLLLVAKGIKEIVLISQETTMYGADLNDKQTNLIALLEDIVTIPDLSWVRLLYLHPDDFDDPLLELIAAEEKICSYIDLPIQHIDEAMLRLMGRRKGEKELRKSIECLKSFPALFLRTSVIVGHPGETRSAFLKLKRFLADLEFDYLAVFPYSDEEGTRSEKMAKKPAKTTIARRYDELFEQQKVIYERRFRALKGTIQPALIERVARETDLLLEGRIAGQAPEIDGVLYINKGHCRPGQIRRVKISDTRGTDLVGTSLR